MNVLVTGATGFVGSRIVELLNLKENFIAISAIRKESTLAVSKSQRVIVGDLEADTEWHSALNSITVVIHTAARVHIMNDAANDPLSEFRRVNVQGTLNLARQAAAAGVKRFVFLSSIKVNGASTRLNHSFTDIDIPSPIEPYGISKLETEEGLRKISKEMGMEIVCIRTPLVYGPKVKANFKSMMKWLYKEVPLPFGTIQNKRSLVALDNLVSLILICIDHPKAANETFLVSDGEDLSTTELLKRSSAALGKKSWLLPINQKLLEFFLMLVGGKALVERLCGSLQVDISKTKKILNWEPLVSVDEGLRRTAEHYIESQK